ncbi:uncharacterized protein [Chelonus insularis]|uniref:uncharacterized protein n=1 Tax=Chelonus insularis TaxID=460826 RepID=UPI00158D3465|nr:uncharacterized protein LOC118072266 [Chelonus insularis]
MLDNMTFENVMVKLEGVFMLKANHPNEEIELSLHENYISLKTQTSVEYKAAKTFVTKEELKALEVWLDKCKKQGVKAVLPSTVKKQEIVDPVEEQWLATRISNDRTNDDSSGDDGKSDERISNDRTNDDSSGDDGKSDEGTRYDGTSYKRSVNTTRAMIHNVEGDNITQLATETKGKGLPKIIETKPVKISLKKFNVPKLLNKSDNKNCLDDTNTETKQKTDEKATAWIPCFNAMDNMLLQQSKMLASLTETMKSMEKRQSEIMEELCRNRQNMSDLGKQVEKIECNIKQAEANRNQTKSGETRAAMTVKKGTSARCYECSDFGHISYDCPRKGTGVVKCYECNKFTNHKADECPQRQERLKKQGSTSGRVYKEVMAGIITIKTYKNLDRLTTDDRH